FPQRARLRTAARQFVDSHLGQPLTLGAVAHVAHLSRFHFCRVFKKWTGQTFSAFVTRQRVGKALALLAEPENRIADVAHGAGFGSMARFYSAFRAATGRSPSDYRRENGGAGAKKGDAGASARK
ncbi:MAG: helix-turn-helix transcriptional regulator, partial [Gammaproteobacteria bacterium]|nr:helix-turn-helix transcriptional regulator [Gammaproteobacteria bacterium]